MNNYLHRMPLSRWEIFLVDYFACQLLLPVLNRPANLQEKLGEQPRETGDSRPDDNDQHAGEDNHRKNTDSDARPTQEDLDQGSH